MKYLARFARMGSWALAIIYAVGVVLLLIGGYAFASFGAYSIVHGIWVPWVLLVVVVVGYMVYQIADDKWHMSRRREEWPFDD